MASIRELKERIVSVKKTQKMTKAMKMVSAAKFKRGTKRIASSEAYSDAIEEMLTNTLSRLEPDFVPRLMASNKSNKQVVICISGDRGLCGGYNNSIIKATELFLKEQSNPTELVLFGNKAINYFKKRAWPITQSYSSFNDDLTVEKVSIELKSLVDKFRNGEIGKVVIIFNKYRTALSSDLINKVLLPITPESQNTEDKEDGKILSDFIYEPSKAGVLDVFLTEYLNFQLFLALIQSNTAEEGARMAAMDSATGNADEMIEDLTLLYNRTRQSTITKELTEIVGGAEALVQ